MSFDSGQYSYVKYNSLPFKVDLYLDNSADLSGGGGSGNRYVINPAAVMDFNVTDSLNSWASEATIVILYLPTDAPQDNAGNPASTSIGAGAAQNGQTLKTYQFRNDGFDILRFAAVPSKEGLTTGDQVEGPTGLDINSMANDPKWCLSYVYSVYDIEDITPQIPGLDGQLAIYLKAVKLYLRDIRYHLLKTTNLEYSTALSPDATVDPSLANGLQGVLYTGEALGEVFNKALTGQVDGIGDSMFTVDTKGETWDKGAGKIFYTSPAGWNANDDIEYLFSHHSSDAKKYENGVGELCVLYTKRAGFDKLEDICLSPLSYFFEKAGDSSTSPGELQYEHFFTTRSTDIATPAGKFLAPLSPDGGGNVDLQTAKYGQILSYSFVEMSGEANANDLRTRPVYSINIGERTFRTEFTNNKVTDARTAIAQSYIKKVYHEGSEEGLFLPTIHRHKDKVNIFPAFSLNADSNILRNRSGLLDLIYTGAFLNACVTFKTLGLSMRHPGTFIGIDKQDGCMEDDYNYKLYGQWFVLRVDHVFEAGSYLNTIYAVKLHRFSAPSTTFPDTL
jgi:hypothetical protein